MREYLTFKVSVFMMDRDVVPISSFRAVHLDAGGAQIPKDGE